MRGKIPDVERAEPDGVSGGAFWWSVVALLLVIVIAGGAIYLAGRGGAAATKPGVTSTVAATAEIPSARFKEVTREAGVDFIHINGASGEKLLPESMGGGVAFLDYDSDGDQDLLFINSTIWPWNEAVTNSRSGLALYQNDGTGHFKNTTAGSGLEVNLYGMGVAVGDYDNDGQVDIFVSGVEDHRLFHNQKGRFEDVTIRAGLAAQPEGWGTSSAFLDYDNDGDLDLFICHYVRWSRQIDLDGDYRLPAVGRAYGPPNNFPGSFSLLYRNEGQGRFEDVSAESGLHMRNAATGLAKGKALGVCPVDIDSDGWIDLIVANDTVQNFVFQNQRDGTFQEIGAHSGIAFDSYGQTRGAMGIDAARFRNDPALGIAIGNFANEMNALYVSKPDALMFADEATREGVGPASADLLKFSLFFFDYDLDGRLDVLTANGHLEPEVSKIQPAQQYRQPAQLFWNRGDKADVRFVTVPAEKCGGDLLTPIVGRGSAYADMDGDGDLDVVLTQIGGAPLLLRNEQRLGHHWVRFRLVGSRSNRDGIGAWVQITAGGRTLSRQVMPTKGYLSQSELPVTIGLGAATRIDAVEIVWPGNKRQRVDPVTIDRLHVINEL